MAIVKWSEDIGTLHSVVCVLYGMLKSLNLCLICLALWKYEYGFWLFVERKRLFYYILHGDCSDKFFLVSMHIRIEGISPNIVHLLWSLSLKLCILYLNPIILNAKKMSTRKRTRKFLYFGVVPLINTFIHKHKVWMKSFIRMRHKGFGPRTNDV